jgi:hypothetical protein
MRKNYRFLKPISDKKGNFGLTGSDVPLYKNGISHLDFFFSRTFNDLQRKFNFSFSDIWVLFQLDFFAKSLTVSKILFTSAKKPKKVKKSLILN